MPVIIDWTLGPSKTNAIKYYADILELLKTLIGNSPHIIKVVEYIKHIPLTIKYANINTKIFLPYHSDIKCAPIEIKSPEFIKDFIRLCYDKYLEPYQWDRQELVIIPNEIIFYLFSKHNSKDLPIMLNNPYKLTAHSISKNTDCSLINDYYIIIYPSDKKMMFEYNYDVVIRKFSNSYIKNFNFLMKSPNTSDTHFVDNLYYIVNFSNSAVFFGRGMHYLPKFFRDTIAKRFPIFSNLKCQSITICTNSQTKTLSIVKENISTSILVIDNIFITKIDPGLNNLFTFYSLFIFKHKYYKSSSGILNSYIEIELGIGY
jgi:hypothetical protein